MNIIKSWMVYSTTFEKVGKYMELRKYLGKKVKIVDKEGYTWQGVVTEYTPSIDDDNGNENIDVVVEKNNKFNTRGCYEFTENDIKKIKIMK